MWDQKHIVKNYKIKYLASGTSLNYLHILNKHFNNKLNFVIEKTRLVLTIISVL